MTDGFLSLLLDGRNVLIILIVAPLMLSFIGFYMLSRQNGLPRDVAVLSQLYVFPVKSCSGIKLNTTECTVRGLKYDRYTTAAHMVFCLDNHAQFSPRKGVATRVHMAVTHTTDSLQ